MEPNAIWKPTRRAVLAGGSALLAGRRTARGQSGAVVYAYTGCYTTAQRYARGDGIHVYRMDPDTGAWTHAQRLENLVNPSFLTMATDGSRLYSAHGDETYASSYAVDRRTGGISLLNRVETGGRNGVHLTIDPGGRFLLIANYSSGAVAVMALKKDGSIGELAHTAALPGQPGPHRVEQTSSHPHQVVFDPSGRFVVVPDKGLDRVFVFRFDAETGRLTPTAQGSAAARSGSGPRHAAFHPSLPVLWVLNEIANTLAAYYWDAERGHLRAAQILPLLPPDFTGENTGAEIAASAGGRFVYCSNRGHDSIAAFAVDSGSGLLNPIGWTATQGRSPRFIGFDPSRRFLYAANEQSDTVLAFRADPATGRLTPAGQKISIASPVSIAFAKL